MTGSMYSAVAGLKAHMSALSVIGNNVSNVNTNAYKAQRYTFAQAIYSSTRDGSDGTITQGGVNPAQIGYGANIGTIDLDMSSKNYSPTGRALDVMIDGDGFFVVGDKVTLDGSAGISIDDDVTLKKMDLTRLGNFTIDPNGYLVDGQGSVVWGFLQREATAAEIAQYGDKVGTKLNNIVYDDDGTTIKSATMTVDTMTAIRLPNMNGYNVTYPHQVDANGNEVVLTYTAANSKTTHYRAATQDEVAQATATTPTLTFTGNPGDEYYLDNGNYYVAIEPTQVLDTDSVYTASTTLIETFTVTDSSSTSTTYTKTTTITKGADGNIDSSSVYSNGSTTPLTEDAYNTALANAGVTLTSTSTTQYTAAPGTLPRLQPDTVSINEKTGALTIMTSDEQLVVVGYLAIAKVTNPNGVTQFTNGYYQALEGSGEMRITSINGVLEDIGIETAGDTGIITGGLESSGTDLATEITNMITVQRGYQANTRVITVTDSMLEELVNLKR